MATIGIALEAISIVFHVPGIFALAMRGYPCIGATRQTEVLPGGGTITTAGPGGLTSGGCGSRRIAVGSATMFGISVFLVIAMVVNMINSSDYKV